MKKKEKQIDILMRKIKNKIVNNTYVPDHHIHINKTKWDLIASGTHRAIIIKDSNYCAIQIIRFRCNNFSEKEKSVLDVIILSVEDIPENKTLKLLHIILLEVK